MATKKPLVQTGGQLEELKDADALDLSGVNTMIGATDEIDGSKGLVPAPTIADKNKFLRGDGTYADALTDEERAALEQTSGVNTGDQTDISGNAETVSSIAGKVSAGNSIEISGDGTNDVPYAISKKPLLKLIANNCALPNNFAESTNPVQNYRSPHKTGKEGVFLKEILWKNGYLGTNQESNGFHDINITAGILVADKYHQLLFNGQVSGTMAKEWGTAVGKGDVYIPPHTLFWINSDMEAADADSSVVTVAGINRGANTVITYSGVAPKNGDKIRFESVGGTTELNYATNGFTAYKVANLDTLANTFEITTIADAAVNSTGYSAWTSGGISRRVYNWVYNATTPALNGNGAGVIGQTYANRKDYTMGVDLPGGILPATILPLTPANVNAGAIQSATKGQVGSNTLNGIGALYAGALNVSAWYGQAGVNQAGSLYKATTAASGYAAMSGGLVSSIVMSSQGSGHDAQSLPPLFIGGGSSGGFGVANQAIWSPQAILAEAGENDTVQSGILITDSLGVAGNPDLNGNNSIYEVAINNEAGFINFSVNGESAIGWLANNTQQLAFIDELLAKNVRLDFAVVALGVNDFGSYNYSDQDSRVAANNNTIMGILKAKGVKRTIAVTVPPHTTGTFTSAGGQSAAVITDGVNTPSNDNYKENGRVAAYNTGIRTGSIITNQDGFIDLAALVADPSESWKWRSAGQFTLGYYSGVKFTDDGIHANSTAGIPYSALWLDMGAVTNPTTLKYNKDLSNPRNGIIGQIIQSKLPSSAPVSLTTANGKTVTSIELPAGLWNVQGIIKTVLGSADTSEFIAGISQTDNGFGNEDSTNISPDVYTGATATKTLLAPTQTIKVPIGKVATIYLVVRVNFSTGTASAYGTLTAHRIANLW
ncbi:MAG: hypothetical protein R3D71_06045 [Rickettsiales bacterium]